MDHEQGIVGEDGVRHTEDDLGIIERSKAPKRCVIFPRLSREVREVKDCKHKEK